MIAKMIFAIRSSLLLLVVFSLSGCGGSPTGEKSSPSGTTGDAGKGVILLRYNPGSESTTEREEGFLEVMKGHSQINILSSDQYALTSPESSLEKAMQMLQKYEDKVTGIFAVCEPNAIGTLGALEQMRMVGKVKFVGFDPNERMVKALAERKMEGIVLQDPVTMGYLSTKAMIAHLDPAAIKAEDKEKLFDGDKVRKRIPTGEYVATPDNMNEPAMQKLLKPAQATGNEKGPEKPKFRLAVIPKGTTNEFWKSVHFGALQAAAEFGNVEILWKGPHLESDRESQISLVQDFITKKVDGIVLAPLDSQGLIGAVREAKSANIPTVIFDSGLDDHDVYISYVATDNRNGGKLAGQRLAEVLGASK